MRTVVLIPTYNERENVRLLVPEIVARYPDLSILVIDDNSPDGTGAAVREMMAQYPRLALLARPGKQGLGAAYKDAMKRTLADPSVTHLITMDADGSHGVEYIADLLRAAETKDFVIGSRYTKGGGVHNWEPWRHALSASANWYARFVSGLPVSDMTAGFQCIGARVLRNVDLSIIHASGYEFLMELKFALIVEQKASVAEVPITFRSRREGESKMPVARYMLKGLKTPWRLLGKRLGLSK